MEINPQLDLYTLILLTGIIPGMLLAFVLFKKSGLNKSNLWLGWLTLALSLVLTEIFLNHSGLMYRMLHLNNFSESIQFALGPLLFLYVKALINPPVGKKQYWHLLPFVFYSLYMGFEFASPLAQKANNYLVSHRVEVPLSFVPNPVKTDPLQIKSLFTNYIIYGQLLLYVALSLAEVRKALLWSDVHSRKKWMRNLIVLSATGAVLFPVAKYVFSVDTGESIVGVFLTFFLYSIGYFVLIDSPFFQADKKKASAQFMPDEMLAAKASKLEALMASEKIYLSSEISLRQLSEKLGITEHHLSWMINQHLNTNFFGLINRYRIRAAQEILQDESKAHLKIEDVGYEVGYNSKSAFFTAFKKEAQITPQAYRNQFIPGSNR